MKVLVTGSEGQLGSEVVRLLESRHIPCRGVDRADFDLTDAEAVAAYVRGCSPDVIVHCAAYTNVDRAESQPEVCAAVNGMGTLYLVRAALAVRARMVYISSDYVFPGTGDEPVGTDDAYGPKNVYGVSKVQGENAVRSLMTRYYIVRTSGLFGRNGDNFVRTMLRLGAEKKELRVVSDQIVSPTYAKDLARAIGDLIETKQYGIYHVRNEGFLSWAEFARMIMKKAGLSCRIIPVSSLDYPSAARRPLNVRLSGEKLQEAGIAPMPSVEDALERFLEELKQ